MMTLESTPYADQPAAPTATDLSLSTLERYRPERHEPADFDAFWKQTLATCQVSPEMRLTPYDAGLSTLDFFDVSFPGFAGQPVRAWLVQPAGARGPLPCVVQFVGYDDGRGPAINHLLWASAGYAHLVMDNRGQGGETPDRPANPGGEVDGLPVIRGLRHPDDYYYRRVLVDAVAAVAAVRALPQIDPDRVILAGGSQGGGIALATAALVTDPVAALLCDFPFLCHWDRAIRISDRGPYADLARHLGRHRDRTATALATLRYFDGIAFAARTRTPALFSVGLMDRVCPPSTVYAAYNHYAGEKQLVVWEFNDHEGGGAHQTRHQLDYLRGRFAPP